MPDETKRVLDAKKSHGITYDPYGVITKKFIEDASHHLDKGGKLLLLNHDLPEIDEWLRRNGFEFDKEKIAKSYLNEEIVLFIAVKTGYITPESERIHAITFDDQIKLLQAKKEE